MFQTTQEVNIMKKGRQKKVRSIQNIPEIAQFSPRGKPGRPDEAILKLDQFEAIKLAEYQGYDQAEGAAHMGISRASFGRILREARKILATALVEGRTIRIQPPNDTELNIRHVDVPHKIKTKAQIINQKAGQTMEKNLRNSILNYEPKQANETD